MIESLANGDWLTRRRIVAVGWILLGVTLLALGTLWLGSHGTLDSAGRPLGTDFSNVWAAGWMADHGQAAMVWDWPSHYAAQQAAHASKTVPFYGWHYPPPFLLVAALLAQFPYLAALLLWEAGTSVAALLLVQRIVPGPTTRLLALAAPAGFICLTHGQNGFLTAGLLGGGLLLLERRPWVAGLLLGALVYKPQFGILLPLVLLVHRDRRAFLAAAAASLALIALTLLLWGWPVWEAFRASLPLTRDVVIEQGGTGWEKIQSAFSAARDWGAPVAAAYLIQSIVTVAALVGALAATWRAAPPVRNATVMAAALLSTPYVLDYDLVVLAVAVAFLVADGEARGWLRWEKSLLAAAYLIPLVARTIMAATHVPIGLFSIVALIVLALRRGWRFDGLRLPVRASPSRR
ncbi:MAG TPA: glycosyltransferase family 87 protein [Sphingomonadaceae bacterium]|nr:glycosyltransferase family 87 protein [Sphingomonadaceae bacterium]